MLKRVFIAAFAVFGLLLLIAVGLFIAVDDEALVSLLIKRIETVSETHIGYRDDARISRAINPELSLNNLVVEDVSGRYSLETDTFRLKVSLPGLLIGRVDIPHLLLGRTRVHITESAKAPHDDSEQDKAIAVDFSALRFKPQLHDLQVTALTVFLEGEKLRLPAGRIDELSLELLPDKNIPELSARLDVEGEKIYITANLPNVRQALENRRLPFSITLKGLIADSSAVGEIDFSEPDAVVNAEVRLHTPDLLKLPTGIEGVRVPGELTLKAQLNGSFDRLATRNIVVDWRGPGESSLSLSGNIGDTVKLHSADLKLNGRLENTAWLSPLLPDALGEVTSAQITARIANQQSPLHVDEFNMRAKTADQLDLSLAGQFDIADPLGEPGARNMDLKLAFSAPTTRAARALIFDEVPEFGAVTASADIRSTTGDPFLENIKIQTRDDAGIQVKLTGGIARFPLSSESNKGYALDVLMTATQASVMAKRAGLDLPLEVPLNLSYRIEGDTQALQLNQIKLAAGGTDETAIEASGSIVFREWAQQDPLDRVDLMVEVQARDTGLLSAWTAQDFPPLAYRMRGHLHTVSGKHRVDDFHLTTPEGEPLDITESGYAESVTFIPEFGMQGIHINHHARTNDIASLNSLFKLDKTIPAIGPFDFDAIITGTDKKLLISDVDASVGQEDIVLLKAKGRIGHISAAKKWRLEDTHLNVTVASSSSQAVAGAVGWRIPELGPVSGNAVLNDSDKTLGIDDIHLQVGNADEPVLISKGGFGDFYATKDVRIESVLNMHGQLLSAFADSRSLPELGKLEGKMMISDSGGALGMDTLQLNSVKDDILSLNIDGRFTDFSKPETLELNGWLSAQDINLFAALFDLEWPGHGLVELDMQIKRADKGLVFDGKWKSGKEKVDMVLKGDFTRQPPDITGKITAQNFFIPDPAERKREEIAKKREKKKKSNEKKSKQKQPVFSREAIDFDWMHKANVSLDVDIESFDREHSEAESAIFDIRLNSGVLTVRPGTLVYPTGQAVLDLELNGSKETPAFSFALSGENLDPWRGLNVSQSAAQGQVDTRGAELDVDIQLESSGKNRHELAANSTGDVYITMKHGKISQAKMNLLFVDLVGWVSNLAKQRYVDVNCGIADLEIRQGLVSTNALFIDTEKITIAGEGTIDLGKELIDYTFIPKKKSRLIARAEPVTLKGALNDPSVKAIPVKSAALTFGTLIFAPYVFAGMVAGEYATEQLDLGKTDVSVCGKYEQSQKEKRRELREKIESK